MKKTLLVTLILAPWFVVSGQPVYVSTPPEAETKPGNIQLMPSHWDYQQVFDASLFSSIPPGGGSIRSIDLRASPHSGFRDTQLSGILIELSTTTRTVDSLSPVFSENQGVDKFDYWTGQRVDFTSVSTTEGLKIWSPTFSVPYANKTFSYDPSKGNLLMTIRNLYLPEGAIFVAYDGVRGSPYVGSVQADAGALRGTVGSEGLVVSFLFNDVVPEPSGPVLLALGSVVLLGVSSQIAGRKDSDVVP